MVYTISLFSLLMPQDSTYKFSHGADTIHLADSLALVRPETDTKISTLSAKALQENESIGPTGENQIIFGISLLIAFLLIKYARFRWLNRKMDSIYLEKRFSYDGILSNHNPYYRSLDEENKDRFLKRVIFFIEGKEFEYVDMEGEEQMPVLISAAAIQLTFGLEHYMLNYFKKIFILKNEYRYGSYSQPFEGNVSDEGIYFSWSNFSNEYNNYTDGENVGLHEMAHALTYVNFTVQDGMDDSFRSKFYAFSPIARPIFEKMQAGTKTLLDKYAATSYEEFWAVCIETFFERPLPFREQLPDLYAGLCQLLNQDPTTRAKILQPAGSQ
ncbi:MAG: zinc-dependent peptidase [Chitinophagales bacterium]